MPLVMPKMSDEEITEAFYLGHGVGFEGCVARATWRHTSEGRAKELRVEWCLGEDGVGEQGLVENGHDPLREWKRSVECGWHTFIRTPQTAS